MKKGKITILIVSSPGVLQNMLKQTFGSRSDVELTGIANGGLSALKLMKKKAPDLVVIDSNLPESETTELILVIRKYHPRTNTLVLVETSQQFTNATQSGSDFVIRSYDLSSKLDATFLELRSKLPMNGVGGLKLKIKRRKYEFKQ